MNRWVFGSLASIVTFLAPAAHAADYWVAPGGSDGADGSSATPWATLQHAADTAKAGDTVHVKDGSYVGFHVDQGGTQAAPVQFVAEAAGAAITQRNSMTTDGINVENADWVTIDGFTINGMPRAGVRCAVSAHVTVRHIHADANGTWGIFSGFCDDLTVEDNVTSRSVAQHGIYVSNSAQRPIVRRNVVFDNNSCGIHMNGDVSMGGVGTINGALVERNIIYGNGKAGGSAINGDGVNDSIIRNNLIYTTHASGISLYQIDASGPAKNNQILHNTIVVAADGRWALNIVNGSTGNTAYNNILFNLNPGHGAFNMDAASIVGLKSDGNLVTPRFSADDGNSMLDLAGWQALGFDAHSLSGDSTAFAGASSDDYHLASGSAAVDHGVAGAGVTDDLDGHVRPFGAAPDIGCYEWGSTQNAPDAGTLPSSDGGAPTIPDAGRTDAGRDSGVTPPNPGSDAATTPGSDAATTPRSDAGVTPPMPGSDAAGSATPATAPAGETSGCGCRTSGTPPSYGFAWLAAALALLCRRRGDR